MLSHEVMSGVQVFPSLWYWVWLVLSVESVGLLSVMIWGNRSEIRCCALSNVWNGGDGWNPSGDVFVMLEISKDQVIGVDTPGQQVPPCVRYGMTYLLIRYAIGYVLCLVEWGWLLSLWSVFVTFCVNCLNHIVQKGPLCAENLSTASGAICQETVAKHDILL
jgi:hypothetical protein